MPNSINQTQVLPDNKMLIIRNYDLFAHLTNEEFEELDLIHNFIEAEKDDFIYFESHFLNKLYFIKEGFIKLGYIDYQGNEIIKDIIQKGEIFGQFTLERNNLHGEFAKVHKSAVSLCAFNIENFQSVLSKNNQLAIAFTKQVGNKLLKVENRLMNMLNSDVKTRLLRFFYALIQNNPSLIEANYFKMDNFLTHEDISRLIGSSRQTVTIAIKELASSGYLLFNRKTIEVLDIQAMKKAAFGE